jgi:solute carrier family 25 protein 39/40
MVYWPGYAWLSKHPSVVGASAALTASDESSSATLFVASFLSGSLSGAAAALLTTPFDVVKTRVQAHEQVVERQCDRRTSLVHVLRQIVRTEGVRGAFSGAVARLAKIAPACAIMISSYEVGKRWLDRAWA